MTLTIAGPAVAVSPIADLGANTDECLKRLVFGAGVQYISLDLLAALKSIAVNAAVANPDLTIRELVDAWADSTGANAIGVRDMADAVAHVYLPS